jgi:methionine-R-sulfoxide reductase
MRNIGLLVLSLFVCNCTSGQQKNTTSQQPSTNTTMIDKSNTTTPIERVEKTDAEWRKSLTPEQYEILRQKGTERPYTGKLLNNKAEGVYSCAACGFELFTSQQKFDSHCGWPSFYDAVDKGRIKYVTDVTHGMKRTEIMCARCDGHLGHVFDDGPLPTGQRYCVNSVSIDFKKVEVTNK